MPLVESTKFVLDVMVVPALAETQGGSAHCSASNGTVFVASSGPSMAQASAARPELLLWAITNTSTLSNEVIDPCVSSNAGPHLHPSSASTDPLSCHLRALNPAIMWDTSLCPATQP
jgi:hypothetical protein